MRGCDCYLRFLRGFSKISRIFLSPISITNELWRNRSTIDSACVPRPSLLVQSSFILWLNLKRNAGSISLEQWLSLKRNGGSHSPDTWLNRTRNIQLFLTPMVLSPNKPPIIYFFNSLHNFNIRRQPINRINLIDR